LLLNPGPVYPDKLLVLKVFEFHFHILLILRLHLFWLNSLLSSYQKVILLLWKSALPAHLFYLGLVVQPPLTSQVKLVGH